MLKDVAYQIRTPEFWDALDMIGGKRSYLLGGAFGDGKGQPAQSNAVVHGCVPTRFRQSTSSTPGGAHERPRGRCSSRARYLVARRGGGAGEARAGVRDGGRDARDDHRAASAATRASRVNQISTGGRQLQHHHHRAQRLREAQRDRHDQQARRRSRYGGGAARRSAGEARARRSRSDAASSAAAVRRAPGWSDATAALDPADARARGPCRSREPARAAGLIATGYLETQRRRVRRGEQQGSVRATAAQHRRARSRPPCAHPTATGSGWAGAAHHDWSQHRPAALGARAIEKAQRSRNAVAIEPGRYTVVLEPTAVGNLVQLIAGALDARNADEGRSFFSKPGGGNKIGMKVVDERVTLVSDPLDPETPGEHRSPATGCRPRERVWIENGVVKNLSYDRYWAQKQGAAARPAPFGGGAAHDAAATATHRRR